MTPARCELARRRVPLQPGQVLMLRAEQTRHGAMVVVMAAQVTRTDGTTGETDALTMPAAALRAVADAVNSLAGELGMAPRAA